jgi:hypothetical protein
MEGATTGTTKACDTVLDGSVFNIMPYVEGGVVIAGNLSFDWTVTFNWGARYLGMNPNFFYDVNERIVGVHDTLTATSSAPHKYTVENMNLVNYDLLLMQSVINGLNIEDYLVFLLNARPRKDMSDAELEQLMPWSDNARANCAPALAK